MCRDGDVELRRRLHAPHRVIVRPRREREQHARDGVVTPRSAPRPVVGRQVIQPHDSPCLDAARSGRVPGRPTRGEVKGTRVRTFNWWWSCVTSSPMGPSRRAVKKILRIYG